jgi:hypothetical protein
VYSKHSTFEYTSSLWLHFGYTCTRNSGITPTRPNRIFHVTCIPLAFFTLTSSHRVEVQGIQTLTLSTSSRQVHILQLSTPSSHFSSTTFLQHFSTYNPSPNPTTYQQCLQVVNQAASPVQSPSLLPDHPRPGFNVCLLYSSSSELQLMTSPRWSYPPSPQEGKLRSAYRIRCTSLPCCCP